MNLQLLKNNFFLLNKAIFSIIVLLFLTSNSNAQCTYTGTPLTQVDANFTFCVDNNTLNSTAVRAGQFVQVNVVKGFTYTFSVGNVFNGDRKSDYI